MPRVRCLLFPPLVIQTSYLCFVVFYVSDPTLSSFGWDVYSLFFHFYAKQRGCYVWMIKWCERAKKKRRISLVFVVDASSNTELDIFSPTSCPKSNTESRGQKTASNCKSFAATILCKQRTRQKFATFFNPGSLQRTLNLSFDSPKNVRSHLPLSYFRWLVHFYTASFVQFSRH